MITNIFEHFHYLPTCGRPPASFNTSIMRANCDLGCLLSPFGEPRWRQFMLIAPCQWRWSHWRPGCRAGDALIIESGHHPTASVPTLIEWHVCESVWNRAASRLVEGKGEAWPGSGVTGGPGIGRGGVFGSFEGPCQQFALVLHNDRESSTAWLRVLHRACVTLETEWNATHWGSRATC